MCRAVLAVLLLVATPVWAGTWTGGTNIEGGDLSYFSFTSADGTGDAVTVFTVGDSTALFCFQPDTAGAPAGTATVQPRFYPRDGTSSATDSIPMGGANGNPFLNGTGGPASTQNACIVIGTGRYSIDIETACGGGDACIVSVQGWR